MPLEEEGWLGERVRFRRTFKTYRIYEEPPVPIISSFPRTYPHTSDPHLGGLSVIGYREEGVFPLIWKDVKKGCLGLVFTNIKGVVASPRYARVL
jgi:hypothetical protein